MKASVKADFLAKVNALRALHGLAAAAYAAQEDEQVMQASLMMAANASLSHAPPATWRCHTAAGATGAGSSNLMGGVVSPYLSWYGEDENLAGWVNERNSASIGHRRWILNPWLGKLSYGRVSQQYADGRRVMAAAMKTFFFGEPAAAPATVPAFVAYPFRDYPARYAPTDMVLSFTAIADPVNRYGNGGVRYDGATISVTANGTALAVSSVSADYQGFGVANSVQWKVAGLRTGTTYTVRIVGVTGARSADYQYDFRIVD